MSPDPPARPGPPGATYATFHVDHLLVGIEVGRVQEVVRHQPVTPVPLTPAAVRGLVNLRGQVVTVIDVRRHLGLPEQGDPTGAMIAVVRVGEEAVGLLVDGTGDVVAPEEAPGAIPPTVSEHLRSRFLAAVPLAGQVLLVLDPGDLAGAGGPGAGGTRATLRRPA